MRSQHPRHYFHVLHAFHLCLTSYDGDGRGAYTLRAAADPGADGILAEGRYKRSGSCAGAHANTFAEAGLVVCL